MSACDCKKNIEARLLERFVQQSPEATEHHVELKGYSLVVEDDGLRQVSVMPYQYSAEYPLKKGGTKEKITTSSMIFNYCPFCGVSLKKETA